MLKRVLYVTIVVAMLLASMPLVASAAPPEPVDCEQDQHHPRQAEAQSQDDGRRQIQIGQAPVGDEECARQPPRQDQHGRPARPERGRTGRGGEGEERQRAANDDRRQGGGDPWEMRRQDAGGQGRHVEHCSQPGALSASPGSRLRYSQPHSQAVQSQTGAEDSVYPLPQYLAGRRHPPD